MNQVGFVTSNWTVLKDRKQDVKLEQRDVVQILECTARLRVSAQRLQDSLGHSQRRAFLLDEERFDEDLLQLSRAMQTINLRLLEVFIPGALATLQRALSWDDILASRLYDGRGRLRTCSTRHLADLSTALQRFGFPVTWEPSIDPNQTEKALKGLQKGLASIERLCSTLIREHWKPLQADLTRDSGIKPGTIEPGRRRSSWRTPCCTARG